MSKIVEAIAEYVSNNRAKARACTSVSTHALMYTFEYKNNFLWLQVIPTGFFGRSMAEILSIWHKHLTNKQNRANKISELKTIEVKANDVLTN